MHTNAFCPDIGMRALPQNDARAKSGDVQLELVDLVWKHFADEIREAMIEAAEAMSGEKMNAEEA